MANSPTVNLIRRGYAAFSSGDLATLTEIVAPDAVQKVPGNSPQSGEYKGRDAILSFYAATAARTDGTFRVDLDDVFDDTAGSVAAIHQVTARRVGKDLDQRGALVFTVVQDRAEEILGLSADLPTENSFWGGKALPPSPELEVVRQTYEAMATGDADTIGRLIAKDVTVFMGGRNQFSGHHRGRDTFFTLFAEAADQTNSTFELSLTNLFTDGAGHVLSLHRETALKDGRRLDIRHVNLIQVLRGIVVDIHDFSADPDLDDAFWG